jgi:deoxyadenosine/deoxycytidine kinase
VLPWRYIVVEGVIGVGKTSLVKLLATASGGRVNLEVVEENPFLASFYQDRAAHAFQTQIFFLLSRFRQQQALTQPELFSQLVVSDYLFAKDRIFANLNLSDDELALYNQLAGILEDRILRPDLVIYLQASTDLLLERIRMRGRSFERSMEADYIESLNRAYNFFFHHYQDTPLLVVGADHLDYVGVPADLDLLVDQLREPFTGTRFFAPRAGGA